MARARPSWEPADRALRSLQRIRSAASRGELRPTSFARARALIGHPDNLVRWQALIAIENWIPSSPEDVWPIVLEHGRSRNADMRMGVSVCLLETLLGHHFQEYFPRLRGLLESGEPRLADTLLHCWAQGQAKAHWRKVRSLLARTRKS